jgi:hypothetical protein
MDTPTAVQQLDRFLKQYSQADREQLLWAAARMLRDDFEYAVVIWTPAEIGSANREHLQDGSISWGAEFIETQQG